MISPRFSPVSRRRFSLLFISLFAILNATVARAQTTDSPAAEALFQEAVKLMDDGRPEEACPKFLASHNLDPSFGAVFNLAECYATIGRTASAWAAYREAASLAKKVKDLKREGEANTRAKTIEPKLIRLTVLGAVLPHDAIVTRDDLILDPTLLGTPIPVDPGVHVVKVTSPQHRSWTRTVKLDTPGTTLAIEIPFLEALTAPPTPPTITTQPVARQLTTIPDRGDSTVEVGFLGMSMFVGFGAARTHLYPSLGESPKDAFMIDAHAYLRFLRIELTRHVSAELGPVLSFQTVRRFSEFTVLDAGAFGIQAGLSLFDAYGPRGILRGPAIFVVAQGAYAEGLSGILNPGNAGVYDIRGWGTVLRGALEVFGVGPPAKPGLHLGMFGLIESFYGVEKLADMNSALDFPVIAVGCHLSVH